MSFIFTFYLVFCFFNPDFIRRVDFTRISASNTASDDVTNKVTHRIFSSDLLYSYTHFLVEINEKSSHGGFSYDLMMINDSGLLFWATLYIYAFVAISRKKSRCKFPAKTLFFIKYVSNNIEA